jgi:hypothetical protein
MGALLSFAFAHRTRVDRSKRWLLLLAYCFSPSPRSVGLEFVLGEHVICLQKRKLGWTSPHLHYYYTGVNSQQFGSPTKLTKRAGPI